MSKYIHIKQTWWKALYLTAMLTYFYVFMEWVFFVTKPSFMSAMTLAQKIQVFLLTGLILLVPAIVATILLWLTHKILVAIFSRIDFTWLAAVIPAIVAACLSLILIDNFTYTVFKLGVVSTSGIFRSIYALLFIILFAVFFRSFYKLTLSAKSLPKDLVYGVLVLMAASTITFMLQIPKSQLFTRFHNTSMSSQLPNIIFIGIDGVNAENMSAYGYQRETTPQIARLAKKALVVENAFSNSGNTGGSLIALLTGKLPTKTHVVYPPDILMGEDAYQHLPGILKQMGYHTIQVTMPHYGDAYDRNLKEGFDIANFRSEDTFPLLSKLESLEGGSGFYFSASIVERITERLKHAFYIQQMANPYETVTEPTKQITEKQRFKAVLSYLKETQEPVFMHVHMLSTHGPVFAPSEKFFSKGEEQNQSWMIDFYDDAIRDADGYVGDLFKFLTRTGKINNTIVVLYSDHGMNWDPRKRVPLIIWFPDLKYTGHVGGNVQLVDVAPTILDYLTVQKPSWMQGQSILSNNLSPDRVIMSANTATDVVVNGEEGWMLDVKKISPPFYQLGTVDLIACNRWYSLNLRNPLMSFGEVTGSTASCSESDLPSPEEVTDEILKKLQEDGYDVSSYPRDIPIQRIATQ